MTLPVLPSIKHFTLLVTNIEDIQLPNLVAVDKDERVILIAKIKPHACDFQEPKTREFALLDMIDALKFATKNLIPFAMLVDKNNIEIFRWDGHNLSDVILTLNTANALLLYYPDYHELKDKYYTCLDRMIERWLRNLTSNWELQVPPYKQEMEDIGLLKLLEGGTTYVYH